MHTEHLPSGRWRAVVRYDGKKRTTSTARTEGEAKVLGAQLLIAMEAEAGPTSRRPVSAGDVTIGDLLALVRAEGRFSSTYRADFDRVVDRLPAAIKRRKVTAVSTLVAARWWSELAADGWTPHRVKRAHTMMHAAFHRACELGLIRSNPLTYAKPPTVVEPEVDPPSPRVIADLILEADADPCFGAFVRVVADTGCRRGEALGLRWGDLSDPDDAKRVVARFQRAVSYTPATGVEVKDTKAGRKGRRSILLDTDTTAALAAWKSAQGSALGLAAVRPQAFIFSATGDAPRRPDWATQRWARLTAAVGVDVRLHDLRHAVATARLEAGENPVKVSRRLGHSRVSTTTDRYGHLMAVD